MPCEASDRNIPPINAEIKWYELPIGFPLNSNNCSFSLLDKYENRSKK